MLVLGIKVSCFGRLESATDYLAVQWEYEGSLILVSFLIFPAQALLKRSGSTFVDLAI